MCDVGTNSVLDTTCGLDLNSMRVGLVVSGLDTGFSQVIKNVLKFNRGCELYL